MQTITFTCEVITPMFLAGADGTTPELRPASIKGALRFWWRAMNGHLSLEDMKRIEGEIFGDTSQRSSFSLRILEIEQLKINQEKVLPHRENSFFKKAIAAGQKFNIIFYCSKNVKLIEDLFIISSILGGIGGRKRRGFGGFKIIKKYNGLPSDIKSDVFVYPTLLEEIKQLLDSIVPHKFVLNQNEINNLTDKKLNYPHIEKIEIGRADINLLKKIGNVTHNQKQNAGNFIYSQAIGSASPRLASPISISVIKPTLNLLPIIVTLSSPSMDKELNDVQKQFKKAILE